MYTDQPVPVQYSLTQCSEHWQTSPMNMNMPLNEIIQFTINITPEIHLRIYFCFFRFQECRKEFQQCFSYESTKFISRWPVFCFSCTVKQIMTHSCWHSTYQQDQCEEPGIKEGWVVLEIIQLILNTRHAALWKLNLDIPR